MAVALTPPSLQAKEAVTVSSQQVSLTIYNRNFAVVRDQIELELKGGLNFISYDGATSTLEPDSVVFSTDHKEADFDIIEQSYRQDVASPNALLKAFEGSEIDFLSTFSDGGERLIRGKVIRAGGGDPLVEADGKMRFGLPGIPLFPSLGEGSLLKPALEWKIQAVTGGEIEATVAYLTGGLSWFASYNLVSP